GRADALRSPNGCPARMVPGPDLRAALPFPYLQPLRTLAQRCEERGFRSRHPGLGAEGEYGLEKRSPPLLVEMGGNLVEKEDRRCAGTGRHRAGVREHDREDERLLLAGRGKPRRHVLGPVTHPEVVTVRP